MDVLTAVENEPAQSIQQRWSAGKRIAFRFCFVYFGLYCTIGLIQAVLVVPKIELPDPGTLWPFRQIIFWVAAHLFGAKLPLVYSGSGSGDKTFDWTEVFCVLVVALIATVVWTALDRRRAEYVVLFKWFRLYIRFCLAATLLIYGLDKFIPLQMPYPYLLRHVQPFGTFSPMGVLWTSIGAAPHYETFVGLAEMLAAALLMFPKTVTVGALISLADMTQVFMLNMTYDVPVKQYSFHLLLLSAFLLAPQAGRLIDFFVRDRRVEPERIESLFKTPRANRIATVAQFVLWVWICSVYSYQKWIDWHDYGPGRQKSPLYGIWDIEQMTIDGQVRPPVLTDKDRWRRLIFDFPNTSTAEHLNDEFEWLDTTVDAQKHSVELIKAGDKTRKAVFTYERSASVQLKLNGTMAGHTIQMQLRREDEKKFLISSRGFHWVQEYPFNR